MKAMVGFIDEEMLDDLIKFTQYLKVVKEIGKVKYRYYESCINGIYGRNRDVVFYEDSFEVVFELLNGLFEEDKTYKLEHNSCFKSDAIKFNYEESMNYMLSAIPFNLDGNTSVSHLDETNEDIVIDAYVLKIYFKEIKEYVEYLNLNKIEIYEDSNFVNILWEASRASFNTGEEYSDLFVNAKEKCLLFVTNDTYQDFYNLIYRLMSLKKFLANSLNENFPYVIKARSEMYKMILLYKNKKFVLLDENIYEHFSLYYKRSIKAKRKISKRKSGGVFNA